MRTISLQRLRPPQHPRRKNQVRIAQRVIRMQMRYKNDLQSFCLQSRHPILLRRRCPPHHSRTAVDQIRPIIHNHRHRRPPPIRIRARIPGPQYNHASSRSGMIPSESAGATSNRRQEYNKNLHSKPPCPRLQLVMSVLSATLRSRPSPCVSPCSPVPPCGYDLRFRQKFIKEFNRTRPPRLDSSLASSLDSLTSTASHRATTL